MMSPSLQSFALSLRLGLGAVSRCSASGAAAAPSRRGLSAVARASASAVEPVVVEKIAYPVNVHRSDAAARVVKVPVIEVTTGHVAMCNGGGGEETLTAPPSQPRRARLTAAAAQGPAGAARSCAVTACVVRSHGLPAAALSRSQARRATRLNFCSWTGAQAPSRACAATAGCATSQQGTATTTELLSHIARCLNT